MPKYETILYEVKEKICYITLNRPEKRNAWNHTMRSEFFKAVRVAGEDPDVRVLVVKGAGKGFCAGADMSEHYEPTVEQWLDIYGKNTEEELFRIFFMPKPTIAQVHGFALAAGLWQMRACDIVIASEDAKLGVPQIRQGADVIKFPLPLTSRGKMMMFALTGDFIGAREAVEMGLVDKVVPYDRLDKEVYKLAKKIALLPPSHVKFVKWGLNQFYNWNLFNYLQYAAVAGSLMQTTKESKEWTARYGPEVKEFMRQRDALFAELDKI